MVQRAVPNDLQLALASQGFPNLQSEDQQESAQSCELDCTAAAPTLRSILSSSEQNSVPAMTVSLPS